MTKFFFLYIQRIPVVLGERKQQFQNGRWKERIAMLFSDIGLKPTERNRIFAFSLFEKRFACRSWGCCFHKGLSPWHGSKSQPEFWKWDSEGRTEPTSVLLHWPQCGSTMFRFPGKPLVPLIHSLHKCF